VNVLPVIATRRIDAGCPSWMSQTRVRAARLVLRRRQPLDDRHDLRVEVALVRVEPLHVRGRVTERYGVEDLACLRAALPRAADAEAAEQAAAALLEVAAQVIGREAAGAHHVELGQPILRALVHLDDEPALAGDRIDLQRIADHDEVEVAVPGIERRQRAAHVVAEPVLVEVAGPVPEESLAPGAHHAAEPVIAELLIAAERDVGDRDAMALAHIEDERHLSGPVGQRLETVRDAVQLEAAARQQLTRDRLGVRRAARLERAAIRRPAESRTTAARTFSSPRNSMLPMSGCSTTTKRSVGGVPSGSAGFVTA
jgi:hypothetical protein